MKKLRYLLYFSILINLSIPFIVYRAIAYRQNVNLYLEKYHNAIHELSQRNVFTRENRLLKGKERGDVILFGTQVIANLPDTDSLAGYRVLNRGISGQRVAGYLLRFKQDVLDLKPKVVFIEVSSYNFRPNYDVQEIIDYIQMASELAQYHRIVPILTTVIPPAKDKALAAEYYQPWHNTYMILDSLNKYNTWIKTYCQEANLPFVDLNSIMAGPDGYINPLLAANAVEPNAEGYRLLTAELEKELLKIKPNYE